MAERFVIIGGVAAGTSAAAKIRRSREDAEIVIYEKDKYISYGSCGLPYFVSGTIENLSSLLVNTPRGFEKRFNIKVKNHCLVTRIDPESKTIEVKDLREDKAFTDSWDKLIIATGSKPLKLNLEGADSENVFVLKTIDDGIRLKRYLDGLQGDGLQAVIIGGGFIGLELLEAFRKKGIKVTIVEKTAQLLPMFDRQIIGYLHDYLKSEGIEIHTGKEIAKMTAGNGRVKSVETADGIKIRADIVFFGVGTIPESELAKKTGLAVGKNGAISVDKYMQTSISGIYAAGDCCQCTNEITGQKRPYNLASIANRQGRAAGYNACGGSDVFEGSCVTSIIKVLDVAIAKTGIGLKEAEMAGIDAGIIELHHLSHAGYYPGAEMIHMMLLYRKDDGQVLGLQAIGREGADKKADIVSAAIRGRMKVWDLANLDLCYQPEYGSAKDAVNILGMIGENIKKEEVRFIETSQLEQMIKEDRDFTLLDVRTAGEYEEVNIEGSVNINIDQLRDNLDKLDKNKLVVVYCKTGYRAYLGYRILANNGFADVRVLNGSITSWLRKL
ncbi:MAG: FAD-dependent oxidoreductase [Actinomycetota bacterium]